MSEGKCDLDLSKKVACRTYRQGRADLVFLRMLVFLENAVTFETVRVGPRFELSGIDGFAKSSLDSGRRRVEY